MPHAQRRNKAEVFSEWESLSNSELNQRYSGKRLNGWDTCIYVGIVMSEAVVRLDEKGRIIIPKTIRKAARVKPGTLVSIKAKDSTIIIEPAESIAEKYAGTFQISKWPEDLDEILTEATKKWWTNHTST